MSWNPFANYAHSRLYDYHRMGFRPNNFKRYWEVNRAGEARARTRMVGFWADRRTKKSYRGTILGRMLKNPGAFWFGHKAQPYFAKAGRMFDAAVSGYYVSNKARAAAQATGAVAEGRKLTGAQRATQARRGFDYLARGFRKLPKKTRIGIPLALLATFAWNKRKERGKYYTHYFD